MKAMNNENIKNVNVNEINEQELEQVNGGLNFFRTAESKVQIPKWPARTLADDDNLHGGRPYPYGW